MKPPRRPMGSVKDAVIRAIEAGESCPECADRTGILRHTLYGCAARMGMAFASAVCRRKQAKARRRWIVSWCHRRQLFTVSQGAGHPVTATFGDRHSAISHAHALERGELAVTR